MRRVDLRVRRCGWPGRHPHPVRALGGVCHAGARRCVRGGAFGNERPWIHGAIRRALRMVQGVDLDVRLVSCPARRAPGAWSLPGGIASRGRFCDPSPADL